MPRCDMCFKEKASLQPPIPKFPAKVCKGCFYEIDRVVGFLEHYGVGLTIQMVMEKVTKATKRKSRPLTAEKRILDQETP
ncbi:hypothetical protein ES703_117568 [subsurface metagenome]